MLRSLSALCAAFLLAGCLQNSPATVATIGLSPEPGETAEAFEARVHQAFSLAQPGTVFEFGAGTFPFVRGITVTASHITIRGQGMDQTILDFTNAVDAGGIFASGNEFTVEDLGVFDTPGNGVKTVGSVGVYLRRVSVVWPNEGDPTNGPYGLYPVLSENILIDECYVKGAEDAGIYVGQSNNVIVRNSTAEKNVAGIEIENTTNAEVFNNVATGNAGGVLVFDLAGLSQPGSGVRVHHNEIYDNNGKNFGSGFVALVPPGTGVLLMATDNVEVDHNLIHDNNTAGVATVSYFLSGQGFDPAQFDPYPETIHVHDNVMYNNGNSPDFIPQGETMPNLIAQVIAVQFGSPSGPIPDVMWDRVTNAAKLQPDGHLPPALNFCIGNNVDDTGAPASFGTMAAPPSGDKFDESGNTCTHPPVPPVTLPPPAPLPPAAQELSPEETALLCDAVTPGVNWAAFEANCPNLSDYNLFQNNDPRGPVTEQGLEYELTTPLFSDYSNKYRFVFVPPGAYALYRQDDVFDFPVGTIISKAFAFDEAAGERMIETRLLIKRDSGWRALVYIHDEEINEAFYIPQGGVAPVTFAKPDGEVVSVDYRIPDVNQCSGCHSGINQPMDIIGPKARLLNRLGPDDGAYEDLNQLVTWRDAGILDYLPPLEDVDRLPVWSDEQDGTLAERARAYLESNCAHCHRPEGRAGFTSLWLTVDTPEGFNLGYCKSPIAAGAGRGGLEHDIVPGDWVNSILPFRMASVTPAIQMPELAKVIVHEEGTELVRDWIQSLSGGCPPAP